MADPRALLRVDIYQKLREEILSCELPPGADLREQNLAARFSVSKSPVRDALLRLERERLVTISPRQGYRVAPVSVADARDFSLGRVFDGAYCVFESLNHVPDVEGLCLAFRCVREHLRTGAAFLFDLNRDLHEESPPIEREMWRIAARSARPDRGLERFVAAQRTPR